MGASDNELYYEREQTQIKHVILEKYLERFALIVGSFAKEIIYIDAFSGPWNSVSNDLRDSSFAIALKQLRSARDSLETQTGRRLGITCVFLEIDANAFQQLEKFANEQNDVKIVALNQSFESAIPNLNRLIDGRPSDHFPFILIDPKGWSGFSMDAIASLIKHRPCELLVNFMTGHIKRFVQDDREAIKATFRRLFGDDSFERKIDGKSGQEREDAIVSAYAERLASVGSYDYTCTTFVLQPLRDRTHFHLIYATRNVKGVQVFKDAERKALAISEAIRSDAKRRERISSTGQLELFSGETLPETRYQDELQEHYERIVLDELAVTFASNKTISYDQLVGRMLRFPMVDEAFLKSWIKTNCEVIGLKNGRVPQIRKNHIIKMKSV